MRTLFLLLFLHAVALQARELPPDSAQVAKLYSTSWLLTSQYHPTGIFHRLKKSTSVSTQRLTIYANEIHTAVNDGPYQVCASRHRNQNEFWLDCKQPDQVIYRVIKIEGDLLIMDILTRPKGKTGYIRTSRNYYTRSKT